MKSHNTAVGPDEIHYEFLKQLPSCSLDFLLQAFNEVWVSGKFPTSWKQATIIPIPKPGKDNTDPSNYRPIALTSCLCKTLERMINTRLIWFLESNRPGASGAHHAPPPPRTNFHGSQIGP